MNSFHLTGRLADDPKEYHKGTEHRFVTLCLIRDEGYRDGQGNWVPRPEAFNFIIGAHLQGKCNHVLTQGQKGRFCEIRARVNIRERRLPPQKTIDETLHYLLKSPVFLVEEIHFPVADRKASPKTGQETESTEVGERPETGEPVEGV